MKNLDNGGCINVHVDNQGEARLEWAPGDLATQDPEFSIGMTADECLCVAMMLIRVARELTPEGD